jgi:hypothetical protein
MGSQEPSEPFVLGQQIGNAREHEKTRLQEGNIRPSPLHGGEYEPRIGEWELLNPRPSDLDSQIRNDCRTFAALPEAQRAEFTSAISLNEFYKLITFANRVAVFALRERDADLLQDGLTALAMIEARRTDFRDILSALALLHHTATRIGVDAASVFQKTANLAEPGTRGYLAGFALRDERYKNVRDSWGYLEVDTVFGKGFVRWGFKPYAPEVDLLATSMKVAAIIDADRYRTDFIELANCLPGVWLKTPETSSLDETLSRILGGATVTARLRPDQHAGAMSQQFTIFLIETDSTDSASALLNISQSKRPKDYAMLGVAANRVFCLVIARSFVQGVDAFENGESLNRFLKPIQKAISPS